MLRHSPKFKLRDLVKEWLLTAELDIPVLINVSKRNKNLHEFLLQLHSIFNGTYNVRAVKSAVEH